MDSRLQIWSQSKKEPSPDPVRRLCIRFRSLEQAQGKGQQDPDQGNPFRSGSKHLVQAAALGLAQISVGIAGDRTGQTGLLTGLQQNHNNQAHTDQSLKDS